MDITVEINKRNRECNIASQIVTIDYVRRDDDVFNTAVVVRCIDDGRRSDVGRAV